MLATCVDGWLISVDHPLVFPPFNRRSAWGFLRTPARTLIGFGVLLLCMALGTLARESGNTGFDAGALWPLAAVGGVLVVAGWVLYVLRIATPSWWPFRDL